MRSPRIAVVALVASLVLSGAVAAASTAAGAQDATSSTSTTLDRSMTTTPTLDADNAPDYDSDGGGDLDLERLSGPRVEDSTPGRAAGLPLGIAAVAIMVVVVVLVVRSARFNRQRNMQKPGPPQG